MYRAKRVYVWLVGLCICVAALSGCGSNGTGLGTETEVKDSDISGVRPQGDVIRYTIDGYDVSIFCDGTTRVYLKYNSIAVSSNDPQCGAIQ